MIGQACTKVVISSASSKIAISCSIRGFYRWSGCTQRPCKVNRYVKHLHEALRNNVVCSWRACWKVYMYTQTALLDLACINNPLPMGCPEAHMLASLLHASEEPPS